jgi:UDP-N-acetylglucosamine acyltransferase
MTTEIHPTAIVDSSASLGEGVSVGPYSVIGAHVEIGASARVMAHVYLDGHTRIGANCTIFPFASIGTQTQDLKFKGGTTHVDIGERTVIREYVTVNSGTEDGEVTRVGSGCLLMAYSHVAHGCIVGNEVILANCGTLAGHVVLDDHAILGGLSAVHQFVHIGRLAIIGGCSKITQDCPPFMIIDGHPAQVRGLNRVGLQRHGFDEDSMKNLKAAYRILYREGKSVTQAVENLRAEFGDDAEIRELIEFIFRSERGIIK